jgi:hypothetical protein
MLAIPKDIIMAHHCSVCGKRGHNVATCKEVGFAHPMFLTAKQRIEKAGYPTVYRAPSKTALKAQAKLNRLNKMLVQIEKKLGRRLTEREISIFMQ